MPKASPAVRSLPYPAIEHGNFSFQDGEYSATPHLRDTSGCSVELEHKLIGAPFIESLIEKGEAKYGCLVSVPKTGYRKLFLTNSCKQKVTWKLAVVGEPPILGPVILYIGDDKQHKFVEKDGVAKVWQGREVIIPKGARLARGHYLRPRATMLNLLSVKLRKEMPAGNFTVVDNSNKGFHFTLEAAQDVYNFVQKPEGESRLRKSILIHAISRCFEILKEKYSDSSEDEDTSSNWDELSNLRALARWLDDQKISHWSEENFDPVLEATKLYPVDIPKNNKDEE